MASQTITAKGPNDKLDELPGRHRYVARQPILDLHGKVRGYELLFRSGPEEIFRGDGDHATRTMLDNTVLFGLEKLTGGLPVFVNCTLEALTGQLVDVLPPSMTVLEVLETIEPTPEVIAACRRLKSLGFRLALDDFVWAPQFEPLVEIADYVKVDFLQSGRDERRQLLRRLQCKATALLAEKIETQQDYEEACAEGFTLFQGYYFCRPTLLKHRAVPANRLSQFEILRALKHSPLDLGAVSQLVKRDAGLTYRLLRLVNSPMCAVRQEIRSVRTALLVVGEDTFRRIAMLAIVSEFNASQPAEILRMALVRARFCELASTLCALDFTEQYLLGLFSLLPAMLQVSMTELTPALPLRDSIRDALLGAPGRERCLLQWIESNERGDWRQCDAIALSNGLDQDRLADYAGQAVEWAGTTLRLAI
ncbi:MAG TPA: HDOD domain-containing protein [Terracidiphilus sp.]|nr:HDOD domain-containing protein [Terracidiphilus sp.]